MNNQQIKYARERIERIFNSKRKSVYTKMPPSDVLRGEIYNGDFRLTDESDHKFVLGSSHELSRYIVTPSMEKAIEEADKERKLQEELKKDRDRILDELMLGDQEEALRLIRAFEEKEVN